MTGERIKKLRKERGLTQEQLGKLLGVKKSAIAKYENNRVENLKKETIQKLSEIFEVPAFYFLGIDEPEQPTLTNSITIPLYNDISCGTGIFAAAWAAPPAAAASPAPLPEKISRDAGWWEKSKRSCRSPVQNYAVS